MSRRRLQAAEINDDPGAGAEMLPMEDVETSEEDTRRLYLIYREMGGETIEELEDLVEEGASQSPDASPGSDASAEAPERQ